MHAMKSQLLCSAFAFFYASIVKSSGDMSLYCFGFASCMTHFFRKQRAREIYKRNSEAFWKKFCSLNGFHANDLIVKHTILHWKKWRNWILIKSIDFYICFPLCFCLSRRLDLNFKSPRWDFGPRMSFLLLRIVVLIGFSLPVKTAHRKVVHPSWREAVPSPWAHAIDGGILSRAVGDGTDSAWCE